MLNQKVYQIVKYFEPLAGEPEIQYLFSIIISIDFFLNRQHYYKKLNAAFIAAFSFVSIIQYYTTKAATRVNQILELQKRLTHYQW